MRLYPPVWLIGRRAIRSTTIGGAAELPRFAYFPFGGGARHCIGESFSEAMTVILLATIAGQWRIRPLPGPPPVPLPRLTLRPRDGLPVTAHRRR